jgi:putative ubiquitin-RnfH superfamily antitoxin RatB of RatAB toxin-antitoxin module
MSEPQEGLEVGVEVAYAEPGRAVLRAFRVVRGATIAQVLELAAACPEFAGIDVRHSAVGVFGRRALPERAVEEGDRVEILRPLAIDPKAARRARAREARKKS